MTAQAWTESRAPARAGGGSWTAADADVDRLAWRPPHGLAREALGIAAECPVTTVRLTATTAGELVPLAEDLAAVEAWLQRQPPEVCAVQADFPVLRDDRATVRLRLWRPAVWWLEQPDGSGQARFAADIAQPQDLLAILRPPAARVPSSPAEPGRMLDLREIVQLLDLERPHPGGLRKIVAAWPQRLPTRAPPSALLAALQRNRPDAFVIDVQRPGLRCLCASPELLLRGAGPKLETVSLAGTLAVGREVEDDVLAREHACVLDFLTATLQGLGARTEVGRRQPHGAGPLHHLGTAVTAHRPAGLGLLTAALHLSPTPALLGTPRARALAQVQALEPATRGWYGGFAGILEPGGDGTLAVLLRGAGRDDDGGWTAWAGAGLVAGAQPTQESAEIQRKHQAIRASFDLEVA